MCHRGTTEERFGLRLSFIARPARDSRQSRLFRLSVRLSFRNGDNKARTTVPFEQHSERILRLGVGEGGGGQNCAANIIFPPVHNIADPLFHRDA